MGKVRARFGGMGRFKLVIGCKIHFLSCMNINVCWKCVYTSIL